MTAPAHYIRPTPAGSSRDTFATLRMREALRIAPKPTPAEHWASLPMATRQALASQALGIRGLDVFALSWDSIGGHDRLRIIAAASRLAAGLV